MKIRIKTTFWNNIPKEKLHKIQTIYIVQLLLIYINWLFSLNTAMLTLNTLWIIITIIHLISVTKQMKIDKQEEEILQNDKTK